MKTILYLHGLESKSAGAKAELLMSEYLVHAPIIDYREEGIYTKLVKLTYKVLPDIIVGSSMGGFFAHLITKNIYPNAELILINPAINVVKDYLKFPVRVNTTFTCEDTRDTKGLLILGMHDEVVDPYETLETFSKTTRLSKERLEGEGHRIDVQTFKRVLDKYGYLK